MLKVTIADNLNLLDEDIAAYDLNVDVIATSVNTHLRLRATIYIDSFGGFEEHLIGDFENIETLAQSVSDFIRMQFPDTKDQHIPEEIKGFIIGWFTNLDTTVL